VQDKRAEIGLCVLLAAADGDVSQSEIDELSRRLGSLLGDAYPPLAIGVAVDEEIGRMHELGAEGYIESLASRLDGKDVIPTLRAALAIAGADGLAAEEVQMFHDVADVFGLKRADADALLAKAQEKA
jgi:tellurite resistance protein